MRTNLVLCFSLSSAYSIAWSRRHEWTSRLRCPLLSVGCGGYAHHGPSVIAVAKQTATVVALKRHVSSSRSIGVVMNAPTEDTPYTKSMVNKHSQPWAYDLPTAKQCIMKTPSVSSIRPTVWWSLHKKQLCWLKIFSLEPCWVFNFVNFDFCGHLHLTLGE